VRMGGGGGGEGEQMKCFAVRRNIIQT